jgi:hypothetical protein
MFAAESERRPFLTSAWQAALILAAGLLVRIVLISQPIQTLVGGLTADDCYYYLTIARRIAAGQGPTFDGQMLTNGFHPLYQLALVPLLALAGQSREMGLRLALALVAVLDVLVAVGVYLLVRGRCGHQAGMIGALSWLFNPWAMTTALNGVESALYALMVVVTLSVYLPRTAAVWQGRGSALLVGLLAGLAILSRTDGFFLAGAIALDGLRRLWQRKTDVRRALQAASLLTAGALIVTGPWWLWNVQQFGTIMQVSGQALLRQWHGADWLSPAAYRAGTLTALRRFGLRVAVFLVQFWPLFALALWARTGRSRPPAAPAAGAADRMGSLLHESASVLRFRAAFRKIADARMKSASNLAPATPMGRLEAGLGGDGWLFVPIVYAIALTVWYVFYFWHIQNWYLMPLMLVASLAIGRLYPHIRHALRGLGQRATPAVGVYLVASFVAILVVVGATRGFGYPRQVDGWRITQWLDQNTQPGDSIGVWNAGIAGYFSHRRVVNLDGVTNNDLYGWVGERGFPLTPATAIEYALERGITYVTDYEDALTPLLSTAAGRRLAAVHRFANSHVVIYRLVVP